LPQNNARIPRISGTLRCTRRASKLYLVCAFTLFVFCSETIVQSQQPIYQSGHYTVWPDHVTEGAYSAHAVSSTEIVSNYPSGRAPAGTESRWTLDEDISRYPQVRSDLPLLDALYNLSLSELKKDTREDGAFNAGAKWQGVWTRDVSYSTLLSLAAIEPEAARVSLLKKVQRDRIVQDTGTGGSWPVSTDRLTWALAAWEIYLVTGDRQWLEQSYAIVRNSILDDQHVAIDPATGLAHGESSFLDWREQTYPRWMQPADIYSSENLGTNAVYYRTYRILALMAAELGQSTDDRNAKDWNARAERIRTAMNQSFWMEDRGYYGQYLYGRVWQVLSPRSDALGEALSILFDIPDPARQDTILRSQPLMPYGIPTVYPETPGIPPYHNRSVWPFVQAFWNLAAARRENGPALLYGLASIVRASAFFLTNKENFVADTGSPIGTEINSDRQLWSVAGNLAMVYRVFFGMDFELDGLRLHPVIPKEFQGQRLLTNFHYRNAVLSLEVRGYGSNVRQFTLDGKSAPALIPANITGSHSIVIELDDRPLRQPALNLVPDATAPDTPQPRLQGATLTWNSEEAAKQYTVYRNGKAIATTSETSLSLPAVTGFTQYQVAAVSGTGFSSFLSAPVSGAEQPVTIPIANSFVITDLADNPNLSWDGNVSTKGRYSLSVHYANGSGPINTNNKCAIRTLFIDGREIGPIVMPQRGQDNWSDWGWSNGHTAQLTAGPHRFELRMLPQDANMNGETNRAFVDSISLTPLD
jgi:hypothetical protein